LVFLLFSEENEEAVPRVTAGLEFAPDGYVSPNVRTKGVFLSRGQRRSNERW